MPREHRGEPYRIRPFFFPRKYLGYSFRLVIFFRELDPSNFRIHRSCRYHSRAEFRRVVYPNRVETHRDTRMYVYLFQEKIKVVSKNGTTLRNPDFGEFHSPIRIENYRKGVYNIVTRK